MLDKWDQMMCERKGENEVEIEISEWFQGLTEDVITKMTFGNSFEQGKAIFKLHSQQMFLAAQSFRKLFIPGYRYIYISLLYTTYIFFVFANYERYLYNFALYR